jgi:hypothetical protein
MIMFSSWEIIPQVDSGTVATPGQYKVETFHGFISGTGSFVTKPLVSENYNQIYAFDIYFTKATDSVNVTVTRQDSWFSNKWDATKVVLSAADSATIQYTVQDTIYKYPLASKYLIKGNSGNGYNVEFTAKAVLKRE